MIKAGHIDNENHAKTFSNYLYIQNIENKIECNSQNSWELWILDSDHLSKAESFLADFLKNPDASEYSKASELAEKKRIEEEKDLKEFRKNMHDRDKILSRWKFNIKSITGLFIIISVVVTLISPLGQNNDLGKILTITEYKVDDGYIVWQKNLPEIRHGQIWRLITPIFIHAPIAGIGFGFGFLHILFNMMWLKDLGYALEKKHGTLFLLMMICIFGALSNLGQFINSGPTFGGMSGVVYGLLGYIWIRGRYDQNFGMRLHRNTVIMMIAWFFLCMTGTLGSIANTAHGVGLVTGMAWGFLSAKAATLKKERGE